MNDKESLLVEKTLELISGRWRMSLLCLLSENGTMRFGELKKKLPGITQRVLTSQLKRLEGEKLLTRESFGEVPPRVEYTLTPSGQALEGIIVALYDWGEKYVAGDDGK